MQKIQEYQKTKQVIQFWTRYEGYSFKETSQKSAISLYKTCVAISDASNTALQSHTG